MNALTQTLRLAIKGDSRGGVNALRGFGREADNTSGGLDRMGEMGRVAGLALAAGLAVAIGAIVKLTGKAIDAVKSFAAFDKGMREVYTLMPGISRRAMDSMSDDVKNFANEFGVLTSEVVPALYQAISAGVPKKNVFDFLKIAQKAATGGVTELATAVDGISSVVNAYGQDVISATEASDLMFTAVKLGKTNFEELSANLFNVIPTASALGVEFGEVTAGLSAMTAQGTPTSVATTQMRQLFVELSKAGSKTADVFEKIAGKSFKEFIASGKTTQDALKLLERYARDSGIGINDLFGSVEAGNAALALTGKGTEKFNDDLAEMRNSAGATDEAFGTMAGGLAYTWDKIKARAETSMITLGETMAPLAEKLLGRALDKLEEWGDWLSDNQDSVENFFAGLAEHAGTALGVIAELLEVAGELAKIYADLSGLSAETQTSGAQKLLSEKFGGAWWSELGDMLKLQGWDSTQLDQIKALKDALRLDPSTITTMQSANKELQGLSAARLGVEALTAEGVFSQPEADQILATIDALKGDAMKKWLALAKDAGAGGKQASRQLRDPLGRPLKDLKAPKITGASEAGAAARKAIQDELSKETTAKIRLDVDLNWGSGRGDGDAGMSSLGGALSGFRATGIAHSLLGSPYVLGASGPGAFDCSGFVKYVYNRSGLPNFPTFTGNQWVLGKRITGQPLRPGDQLFFRGGRYQDVFGFGHTGIYVGGNQYIHASGRSTGVIKSSLAGHAYEARRHFAAAGADFMTSGPTMILAGERGAEHVKVTPAPRMDVRGGDGTPNLTLHIHGNVYTDELYEIVRDGARDAMAEAGMDVRRASRGRSG